MRNTGESVHDLDFYLLLPTKTGFNWIVANCHKNDGTLKIFPANITTYPHVVNQRSDHTRAISEAQNIISPK
jgi:hypothetical protein